MSFRDIFKQSSSKSLAGFSAEESIDNEEQDLLFTDLLKDALSELLESPYSSTFLGSVCGAYFRAFELKGCT